LLETGDWVAVAFFVVLAVVAVVFVALDVACDALLAAWLLLVDDVQPATLTISTERTPSIKTVFNVIFVIFTPLMAKNESKQKGGVMWLKSYPLVTLCGLLPPASATENATIRIDEHPLPEHVYDVYMKYWENIAFVA
jgi:hypothetical protein